MGEIFFDEKCTSFGGIVVTAQNEKYGNRKSSSRRSSSFEDEERPPFSKKNGNHKDQANNLTSKSSSIKLNAPKHLADGLFQGLGIALSGVLGGISVSLLLPFTLFIKNRDQGSGIRSMLLGGFVGSLAGLVVSASSILLGGIQIARSIVPTWYALRSDRDGFTYRDGSWMPYSLQKEEEATSVTNPLFYNLLEVSTKASSSQIKRAFREKARTIHPDKQPKERQQDAVAQFRQLTTAYETLFDPSRRRFYDLHGTRNNFPTDTIDMIEEDDTAMNMAKAPIDTIAFFHILFGMISNSRSKKNKNDGLVSYIGELRLGSDFSLLIQNIQPQGTNVNATTVQSLFSKNQRLQTKRQLDIALFLRSRIEPYITHGNMTKIEFKESCREEAEEILLTAAAHPDKASQVLTQQYVFEIGKALKMEADEFLSSSSSLPSTNTFTNTLGEIQGLLLGPSYKLISFLRHEVPRRLSIYLNFGKWVFNILFHNEDDNSLWGKIWTQLQKIQRGEGEELQNEEIVEDIMSRLNVIVPSSLELVWKFVKKDLHKTLRDASRKLFIDNDVSYVERVERAKAIRLLGREFIHAAKENEETMKSKINVDEYFSDIQDIIARVKVAFTSSVKKASTGQDIPSAAEREAVIEELKKQQEAAYINSNKDSQYWFSQHQFYDASY